MWWCRALSLQRERLHEMALGLSDDGPMYLFLSAKQDETTVLFLELRPKPRVLDLSATDDDPSRFPPGHVTAYDYLPPVFATEKHVPWAGVDEPDLKARVGIQFIGRQVVAPHPAVFLERAVPQIGQVRKRARRAAPKRRAPTGNELDRLREDPELWWISDDDVMPHPRPAQRRRRPRDLPSPPDDPMGDHDDGGDGGAPGVVGEPGDEDMDEDIIPPHGCRC